MTFRVTYATMSADDDALHEEYDRGIETARSWLGEDHGMHRERRAPPRHRRSGVRGTLPDRPRHRDRPLRVARHPTTCATPSPPRRRRSDWAATPWKERVAILERAADQISEHRSELAALMAMEVGKNRLEALGDVEESADLIRYYCHQMEAHDGFEIPDGAPRRRPRRPATSCGRTACGP